ncbi:DUF551 domain-containing protein [Dyadobacter bucti]|uniref:DUF551 domain-containing protein n=1 Tax=Dyadobacter bucti TaxID=2572203 RepID=UPI0011095B5E
MIYAQKIGFWPLTYVRIGDVSEFRLFGKVIKNQIHSNNWQDISTAPRDGTEILALQDLPTNIYMVVSWDDSSVDENMRWASIDGVYHKDLFTHWQPLPAPPTEA